MEGIMKLTIDEVFRIIIERDIPESHEALLDSVTLTMEVNEIEWGHIKEAWRSSKTTCL
jgi:hypothetical protein